MTSIGFIKDKNGKQYEVSYWVSKLLHGRKRYNIGIYDNNAQAGDKQAGEFELDLHEGDDYAEIDQAYFEVAYRRLGLYRALLPLMRDFMKTQGCKGIFSNGNLRNAMSNAAWDNIPGRKIIPKKYDTNNNASAYPDYVLERKDMVTSISEFKKINEDRRQHIIPFEEPEFQKLSIHAHLQDAFNDLSVMRPDTYYSHGNPEDKMTKLRNKVFNFVVMEGDGGDTSVLTEYVWQFARAYDPTDNSEMYSKKFIKYALSEEEDALEDIYKFAEIAAQESNIKTVFSNAGWVQFKRIAGNIMDSDMENMRYAVESSYKENENGLIECWRVVDYVAGPNGDYYVNIMAHGGVGVYWSWDEDAAEAHHGTSNAHSITLHGFISVENVDWYETMWKNVTHLKDEKEIRTVNNGNIMIVGYHDNEKDQYVKLEHPVVVKTGQ